MSTVFPHYLWDSDLQNKYKEFSNFFIDFKEDQTIEDIQNEVKFSSHIQDKDLPKFSDK